MLIEYGLLPTGLHCVVFIDNISKLTNTTHSESIIWYCNTFKFRFSRVKLKINKQTRHLVIFLLLFRMIIIVFVFTQRSVIGRIFLSCPSYSQYLGEILHSFQIYTSTGDLKQKQKHGD